MGILGDEQPDQFGDRGSYAVAVNEAGDITGIYTGNGDVQTFRYTRATGSLFNIGGIYGKQTIAFGMSDSGTIVGVSWVPNALTGGIRALGHGFISDTWLSGLRQANQYRSNDKGWTLVNANPISPDGTSSVRATAAASCAATASTGRPASSMSCRPGGRATCSRTLSTTRARSWALASPPAAPTSRGGSTPMKAASRA